MRRILAALSVALVVSVTATACDNGATTTENELPAADGSAFSKINSNDFYQCQTDNPRHPTDCSWISGVLNATHNVYYERDVIPQKLRLNEAVWTPAAGGPKTTVVLEYGFRKGGDDSSGDLTGSYHGNYDFMARYDNGTGPYDYCTGDRRMQPVFCDTNEAPVANPMATMSIPVGNTAGLTAVEQTAYAAALAGYALPREMLILGAEPGSAQVTSLYFTRSGDATTAHMEFEFIPAQADVLMLWGMHFAYGGDWDTPLDELWHGAAGQSGSPFHTKMVDVTTGVGSPQQKTLNNGAMAINVSGDVVIVEPDAYISVGADGVNEVGDTHDVTATVTADADDGAGPQPFSGALVTFAITSGPGSFVSGTNTCTTGAAGTCTVQITSAVTGVTVVSAATTITVAETEFNLVTDGTGLNSGPLTKQWVDGYIRLTPESDTNPVGTNHVITATVWQNDGIAGTQYAADGTRVDFAFVSGQNSAGATFVGDAYCLTSGGSCTVTIYSASPGSAQVEATTDITVGGIVITRSTDGTGMNSGPATKNYAAARISVGPSDTNEVGQDHVFTALVERDDGSGFAPVEGVTVDASTSGAGSLDASSCVTDAAGQCTFTASSSVAGVMTLNVSASVPANGGSETIPVTTVDGAGSYGPATKTWVDAYVLLTPLTATNPVGDDHVITATVWAYDGVATAALFEGASVQLSLPTNDAGATFVGGVDSCTTDSNGECTVTINASSPGLVVIHAVATLTLSGLELTRATGSGGENSADAQKTYASPRISIAPHGGNLVGVDHTFTVTVEQDLGAGYVPIENQDVGATHTGVGSFVNDSCTTDASGQCDIVVSSSVAGLMVVTASADVAVNGSTVTVSTDGTGANGDPGEKRWVRAKIDLDPLTDNNLLGTPHALTATLSFDVGSGWAAAGDGESIDLTIQSGPGSFSSSSAVSSTSCSTTAGVCGATLYNATTAGTTVIRASWSGTIAASAGGGTFDVSATATTGTAPSSADAQKTWVGGSVSLTKTADVGALTGPVEICFTLADTGSYSSQLCHTFSTSGAAGSYTYQWTGLAAGDYTITEQVPAGSPYTPISPLNFSLTDESRTYTYGPVNNPLPPGALSIEKRLNGFPNLNGLEFEFTVEYCGVDATCASASEIPASPVTVSDGNNPAVLSNLIEGYYRVTEGLYGYEVLPSLSQTVAVPAGSNSSPVQVQFNNVQQGDVCEGGVKPSALILLYTANGTLNDIHEQAGSEVVIQVLDDANAIAGLRESPVTVVVYDHRDMQLGSTYTAAPGQLIRFESGGNKLIPSRAGFRVFLSGADPTNPSTAIEHVQFHSSCSQPLAPGDEFGSFRLLDSEYR